MGSKIYHQFSHSSRVLVWLERMTSWRSHALVGGLWPTLRNIIHNIVLNVDPLSVVGMLLRASLSVITHSDYTCGPLVEVNLLFGLTIWNSFFFLATCKYSEAYNVSSFPLSAAMSLTKLVNNYVYMCAKSLQLCPTLCDPMDHSPSGSSVHGILQARILEQVVMPFSRGSSWPRDWTQFSYISCIGRWVLYH